MKRMDKTMSELRVGSYNIRHGADAGFDMSLLASVINEAGAEIVGIQEMDMCADRSKNRNQLEELKDATGFEYGVFVKSIDIKGGEYGTAVISKYPILSHESYPLYLGPRSEPRKLGVFKIDLGSSVLTFANTHLDFVSEETILRQMKEVNEILKGEDRYILTGDFNTGNMTLFTAFDGAQFTMNEKRCLITFPSSGKTIDNIVFKGNLEIKDYAVVENSFSDHRMLWAELDVL